jgi:hypothetical protein
VRARTLLSIKELCFTLGISRTTLWRHRQRGAPRDPHELAFWIQEDDAAKCLQIPSAAFHAFPRTVREKLIEAATLLQCNQLEHPGSGGSSAGENK